ncbi:MAG: hypothetical protein IJO96_05975 [Oscillospiraceae bacterium]|nr:hypothetical protein [Oscillospiraceae bacterium]
MKKIRTVVILTLIFSFVFAFSGCSVEEETTNLFEYVIKIEEGIISPRKVEFLASPEEVLEANKDKEVSEQTNPDGYAFKGKAIEGISGDVTECYNFEDDKLVYVEYTVNYDETMSEAEFEAVCNTLYDMAVEYMPKSAFSKNGHEPIKEGRGIIWRDIDGNMAYLTFFTTIKGNVPGFHVSVHVSEHLF